MEKFFSEEIQSQCNLIKMLLTESERYKVVINAIKKDFAYKPIEIEKLEEEEIIL